MLRRILLATTALALLGAAPPAPELPPTVDLGRARNEGGHLVAPAGAGGLAELTLDPALQHDAERLLDEAHPSAGAVVAIDVKSGRILAWADRRKGGRGPSTVTTPQAPAASVFKLVTTATLFEKTDIAPSERVCIAGGLRSIERRHLDPPRDGDIHCGPFFQALGHSRNAVYAQLATHRLMRADLVEVAERIGFNGRLPFDFKVSVGTLDVPYEDLEFARTAAGFRGSTLTPLGGAYLASVIASGGLSPRLRLVARADNYEPPPELQTEGRVLSATTAQRLERMMEVTVASGTARAAFHDELGHSLMGPIQVAGKTGTLHPSEAQGEGVASWFIGFAPARAPSVVVSVLLENGNVWRRKAVEVARDVLRSYFVARGVAGIRAPDFGRPDAAPPSDHVQSAARD
jgi:cell division protein FtsI/penicillin-binding protein 2